VVAANLTKRQLDYEWVLKPESEASKVKIKKIKNKK